MRGQATRERFGLLVLVLVGALMLSGVSDRGYIRLLAALLNLAAFTIGFIGTRSRTRIWAVAGLVAVGVVGAVLVGTYRTAHLGLALGATIQVILLTTLTIAVLGTLSEHTRVTNQTMLGAIAAYLMLGQLFAWAYMALPGYVDEAVLQPAQQGEVPIYYSYVVLTTLGFGDVQPVGALVQRVTVLEALIGQLFVAILLARLASLYSRGGSLIEGRDDAVDSG